MKRSKLFISGPVSGLFNPRAMVKGVYIYGDLVVDWYSVVRWAYIEDLLPKGGEK